MPYKAFADRFTSARIQCHYPRMGRYGAESGQAMNAPEGLFAVSVHKCSDWGPRIQALEESQRFVLWELVDNIEILQERALGDLEVNM